MTFSLTNILVLITGVTLIALLLFAYWRSKQGEQRITQVINQMLLPLLGVITLTTGLLLTNRSLSLTCPGLLAWLPYIGLAGTLLLIISGLVRYFASRSRDRRMITHPIIFAAILMTVVFLVEFLSGCL